MVGATNTFNSFSGADMICTFGGKVIGELQGISFTVQREKAPLYVMGSASPKGFSRGKRGIAGSLIFLVFDRSALKDTIGNDFRYMTPSVDVHSSQDPIKADINWTQGLTEGVGTKSLTMGTVGQPGTAVIRRITVDRVWARPKFADQIPPFNVTITAANEYGNYGKMEIIGVEILNQGSGMSIDDMTTDEACTFMAQDLNTWFGQNTSPKPK